MTDKEQRQIFGENLTYYVEESNMNQKELAEILDVPYTTFNSWCVGRAVPGMRMLHKLADYFGCSVLDLVNRRTENARLRSQIDILLDKNDDVEFYKRLLAYGEFLALLPEERK